MLLILDNMKIKFSNKLDFYLHMSCPMKVNSNKIELPVHTSCYHGKDSPAQRKFALNLHWNFFYHL